MVLTALGIHYVDWGPFNLTWGTLKRTLATWQCYVAAEPPACKATDSPEAGRAVPATHSRASVTLLPCCVRPQLKDGRTWDGKNPTHHGASSGEDQPLVSSPAARRGSPAALRIWP